ncbi:MAG: hypothetical protein ACI9XO_003513 [Paraglaciecola sp.]|jgi:hypothetical protein
MKYLILILPLFLSFQNASAQSGCTDPQANNFDAAATENDGSCIYPTTNYQLTEITQLPSNLEEVSGAGFFNETLWTHEDGGNEDRIYQIDSLMGAIEHIVTIAGADNYDWEDMTEDETHVYVGDFGNNDGNRTNLRVYKISKGDLTENVATAEVIEFIFSDQTDFTLNSNNNNYDCEAMFVFEDSLHLFSKNWVDFKTRHYVLPTTAGEHVAQVRDSLEVQVQITSADISDEGEVLLLGYNTATSEVLLWLLFDYPGNQFFKGNKRKISLGSAISTSQAEGITFRNDRTGYVVSEAFSVLPQKLLRFNVLPFLEEPNAVEEANLKSNIKVFPNPFRDRLIIEMKDVKEPIEAIHLVNLNGEIVAVFEKGDFEHGNAIELDFSNKDLAKGAYFIEIQTIDGIFWNSIVHLK